MNKPLVAIIIVNFNGKEDTLKCLGSLRQDRYVSKQIIVVDNGSANDSVVVIRGAYPKAVLIETGKNMGFGGGNNIGIRHALAAGADYVYLLNNDTTSEPDALSELVKAARENPNFGILAPVMHYMAEPEKIWFGGATLNPQTLEALHDNGSPPERSDPLREIPWATGCATLIPAKVISELGGFDERFFLYSEDVDLSLRARTAGHRIGLVPSARIFHKVGASAKGSPIASYHALRGKLLLQQIHGGDCRDWNSFRIALNALRENLRDFRHGRATPRRAFGPSVSAIWDGLVAWATRNRKENQMRLGGLEGDSVDSGAASGPPAPREAKGKMTVKSEDLASDQCSLKAGSAKAETVAAPPPPALLGGAAHCSLSEARPSADPFFSGRTHFPALDGLRGLAILLVMASHYAFLIPPLLPGIGRLQGVAAKGWVGVDLFFVLSGFLITGILVDSRGQKHFFRNFYARRFLRIFPLYYGFLGVTLAVLLVLRLGSGASFFQHADRADLWRYQPWLWTYTQNIWMAAHEKMMFLVGHFWTLAVEEQFYIFWPAIVWLLGRRRLATACLLLAASSLFLRLAATEAGFHWEAIYVLTPLRLDPFALGALVAICQREPRWRKPMVRLATPAVVGAAILILAALASSLVDGASWRVSPLGSAHSLPGGPWSMDFLYSAIAVFFAAITAMVSSANLAHRVLAWQPLRSMGKYSYAIYVFHYPLLMVLVALAARVGFLHLVHTSVTDGAVFVLINFFVSISVAYASYHLYEKHFLKLKKYFPERVVPGGQVRR